MAVQKLYPGFDLGDCYTLLLATADKAMSALEKGECAVLWDWSSARNRAAQGVKDGGRDKGEEHTNMYGLAKELELEIEGKIKKAYQRREVYKNFHKDDASDNEVTTGAGNALQEEDRKILALCPLLEELRLKLAGWE